MATRWNSKLLHFKEPVIGLRYLWQGVKIPAWESSPHTIFFPFLISFPTSFLRASSLPVKLNSLISHLLPPPRWSFGNSLRRFSLPRSAPVHSCFPPGASSFRHRPRPACLQLRLHPARDLARGRHAHDLWKEPPNAWIASVELKSGNYFLTSHRRGMFP